MFTCALRYHPSTRWHQWSACLFGNSAIAIARQFSGRQRNYTGEHFWARGYCVSTVGYEEEKVRDYIREQEASDEEGRF